MTGIIRPYMKPVWWAIGEAIGITSSGTELQAFGIGMMFAISVFALCITPFGSPSCPT